MEVQVGHKLALLTTHKSYRDDEEGGVRAVANYAPFMRYVAACAEHGPTPSTFIIRNIRRIAQRVVRVIMDVECETTTGKVFQTVDLCNSRAAILLPIASVAGAKYAILSRQQRVSAGCTFTLEAICGEESGDGRFLWPNSEALVAIGFDLEKVYFVNQYRFTVGNEGEAPYRICSVSLDMTQEELSLLLEAPKDVETSLFAVPLENVLSSVRDVRACLAASIMLTHLNV